MRKEEVLESSQEPVNTSTLSPLQGFGIFNPEVIPTKVPQKGQSTNKPKEVDTNQ